MDLSTFRLQMLYKLQWGWWVDITEVINPSMNDYIPVGGNMMGMWNVHSFRRPDSLAWEPNTKRGFLLTPYTKLEMFSVRVPEYDRGVHEIWGYMT